MLIQPLTLQRSIAVANTWPAERTLLLGRLQWHALTPYAHALVAQEGSVVVGVGCAIAHRTTGTITVLRTVDGTSAAEIHAALAQALLAALNAQGCERCSVIAPIGQVEHWAAAGFHAQEQILRYSGGRFFEATRDEVITLEPQHRLAMLHLAQQASGEDRNTLLLEHEYLGSVYLDGTRVRGFSLPLLGEGLIIADTPDVGLELQRWLFPLQEHVLLPAGSGAHAHLVEQGYLPDPVGVRMVHGTPMPWRPEMFYAHP